MHCVTIVSWDSLCKSWGKQQSESETYFLRVTCVSFDMKRIRYLNLRNQCINEAFHILPKQFLSFKYLWIKYDRKNINHWSWMAINGWTKRLIMMWQVISYYNTWFTSLYGVMSMNYLKQALILYVCFWTLLLCLCFSFSKLSWVRK